MTDDNIKNSETRLTKTEAEIVSLVKTVDALAVNTQLSIQNLTDTIDNQNRSLNKSIATIADKLSTSNRTNWGQIFAGVTLLVSIVMMIGYMAIQPLKESLQDTKIELHKHAAAESLVIRESITNLRLNFDDTKKDHDARLKLFDTVIQREINEVDKKSDMRYQTSKELLLMRIIELDKRIGLESNSNRIEALEMQKKWNPSSKNSR